MSPSTVNVWTTKPCGCQSSSKPVVLKLFSWRPGKKNCKEAATQCDRGGVAIVRNSSRPGGGGCKSKISAPRPGTTARPNSDLIATQLLTQNPLFPLQHFFMVSDVTIFHRRHDPVATSWRPGYWVATRGLRNTGFEGKVNFCRWLISWKLKDLIEVGN